jgi:hypothetical protein
MIQTRSDPRGLDGFGKETQEQCQRSVADAESGRAEVYGGHAGSDPRQGRRVFVAAAALFVPLQLALAPMRVLAISDEYALDVAV